MKPEVSQANVTIGSNRRVAVRFRSESQSVDRPDCSIVLNMFDICVHSEGFEFSNHLIASEPDPSCTAAGEHGFRSCRTILTADCTGSSICKLQRMLIGGLM